MANRPAPMFRMSMGIMNGEIAARSALEQDLVLVLGGLESADAGAEEDADLVAIALLEVESGIQQRPVRGADPELGQSDRCGVRPSARGTTGTASKPLTSAAICVSNGAGVEEADAMPHSSGDDVPVQKTSSHRAPAA
jgi:hypothetical protein